MMICKKLIVWHNLLYKIMEWIMILVLLVMNKILTVENYIVKNTNKKLMKESNKL